MTWGWIAAWLGSLVSLVAAPIVFNPPPETPGPFTFWDASLSVRSDLGYRDNVLLSATNLHASGFVGLGADLFIFRMPIDGTAFNFFFTADDRRYFDAAEGTTNQPGASKDQTFITYATLKQPLPHGWSASLVAIHYYADQVYDASDFDGVGFVRAQGHQFGLTPGVRREFGPGWWAEGTFAVTRQIFEDPISSYWESGPKASVGWGYRTNCSLELSFAALRRPYDDRFQVSSSGDPLQSPLTTDDYRTELTWKHAWDAHRHWTTAARLFHVRRRDNGEGWYDVDKLGAALTAKFEQSKWLVRGTVRWTTHDYALQLVAPGSLEVRTRDELELEGRIEYRLHRRLMVYGSYLHEWTRSNVPSDAYRSNTGLAGLEYEF